MKKKNEEDLENLREDLRRAQEYIESGENSDDGEGTANKRERELRMEIGKTKVITEKAVRDQKKLAGMVKRSLVMESHYKENLRNRVFQIERVRKEQRKTYKRDNVDMEMRGLGRTLKLEEKSLKSAKSSMFNSSPFGGLQVIKEENEI